MGYINEIIGHTKLTGLLTVLLVLYVPSHAQRSIPAVEA